ncbi:MAG TPA: tetratricopeptide repeat protein [Verrucomicrobiae bacterium]|jgi:tetratricopeptide (TPR) repeat protein|nr:tetratricopeptide repeat protein [Verrucomicrobiae bacterium]
MADDVNKKDGTSDESRPRARLSRMEQFAQKPTPDVPPSKALQWFLLGALVLTGSAYVAGQWTELRSSPKLVHHETKLQRLVRGQSEYLTHSKIGDEAFAKKRYDVAVAQYRLALQGQTNAAAYLSLGRALLKAGNPEEAFAQFREALALEPSLESVSSEWGMALADAGKPDEAARILQEALQHDPDSGLLHYNLATALLLMRTDAEGRRQMAAGAGQTAEATAAETEAKKLGDEALRHFTKASRNKVDSPAFWFDYGQLLNQLGQHADAETCLLRAVAEDTNMAAAHFQLAMAENQLGKYAGAIDQYRLVLTLRPDDPATLNNLALLYATATNAEVRTPKMAVQLATRACDATTDQNARYMDTLARSYAADGDFFQAITWEEKALHRARQLSDGDLARELEVRDALFVDHKME